MGQKQMGCGSYRGCGSERTVGGSGAANIIVEYSLSNNGEHGIIVAINCGGER